MSGRNLREEGAYYSTDFNGQPEPVPRQRAEERYDHDNHARPSTVLSQRNLMSTKGANGPHSPAKHPAYKQQNSGSENQPQDPSLSQGGRPGSKSGLSKPPEYLHQAQSPKQQTDLFNPKAVPESARNFKSMANERQQPI